jgi:uncharacterized membrane protein
MFSIEGHSNEIMVELLVGVTLLISWVFVQVAFARYYAQEFYSQKAGSDNSGFEFPNNPRPDYWDFIRFAFVIGMRIQVGSLFALGRHRGPIPSANTKISRSENKLSRCQ